MIKLVSNTNNLDTVVQANILIKATHKLEKNEILAFKKIISMVDTKYRTRELKILKKDIITFLYPSLKNKDKIQTLYYKKAKKYCEKLMEIVLKSYEDGANAKFVSYSVLSKFEWPCYENYLSLKFSDDIMPFIFELKKYFTQYQIGVIQKLKSKNTIRLYEYLRMNLHNNEKEYTWTVSLIELKRILDLDNCYSRFNSFNERVLSSCIPEINQKTDIDVTFEPVIEFSKVIELVFTAKEKYPKTQKEIQTNKKLWNENTKSSFSEKAI